MTRTLLRLYPAAWRARYGDELGALIAEASGGGRVPWRMRADVALAGARERLRSAGLSGDGAPREQARGGALLVLVAWALFVLAGCVVAKVAEHSSAALPAAGRALPAAAYDGLVVIACGTGLLVAGGIALTLPSLVSFLRAGGHPAVRRRLRAAVLATALAGAATVALVVWAQGLSPSGRAGRDAAYGAGFLAWAALVALALAAWTAAAVAAARRLRLRAATLELEARLATGVAAGMAAMTAATGVWWAAVAGRAVPALAPALMAAVALMALATALGAAGARRATAALPALRGR